MHYALFIMHTPVHASYVLPYPSFMPGNKAYKISRLLDTISAYWYRGNIAQVKYHLGLSDKYLVESKTLFEYKQYLLGMDALERSTKEFQTVPIYIKNGIAEGKDMKGFQNTITNAAIEHIRVLDEMKKGSPEEFRWTPEKASPSDLSLHNTIDKAVQTIQTVVEDIQK